MSRSARLAATLGFTLALVAGETVHAGPAEASGSTLASHRVVLDASGRLRSWVEPQDQAYATVVRLAWEQLLTGFPVEENGLPTWLTYCCFDGETLRGTAWPHNPASTYAGLVQGAAAWYAFSGDRRPIDLVRRALDYQLANGTTPPDPGWAWPSVPYASSDHGAVRYRGAHDFLYAEKDDPRPRLRAENTRSGTTDWLLKNTKKGPNPPLYAPADEPYPEGCVVGSKWRATARARAYVRETGSPST